MFDVLEFRKIYKGTTLFTESEYFFKFVECLDNADLLNHIKFCNDFLQLPPIYIKILMLINNILKEK